MPAGADGPLAAKRLGRSARRPAARQSHGQREDGRRRRARPSCSAAGVPLAMFRAVAARFAPGTTLDGQLSSDVQASWGSQGAGQNGVQADLSMEAFSLATPALQTDVAAARSAPRRLPGVVAGRSRGDREGRRSIATWAARRCRARCGGTRRAAVARLGCLQQRHELSGRVDVARLARLLPATLRLRQQVEINSGQVQLAAQQPARASRA